jgi:hypothetical protein
MTDEVKQTIKDKTISIHGKDYLTVAGRVELAHDDKENKTLSITTELVEVAYPERILFKATVITPKGTYTGYSAIDPKTGKMIEKLSPYEVAETSAVGRALGFAGYGLVEGIASADEMAKSLASQKAENPDDRPAEWGESRRAPTDTGSLNGYLDRAAEPTPAVTCAECGSLAKEKHGISKNGKPYHAIFCDTGEKSHTVWLP